MFASIPNLSHDHSLRIIVVAKPCLVSNPEPGSSGLTTLLLGLTYLLSLTSTVSMFEYDFFLYIFSDYNQRDRELVAITSIQLAPLWNLILVYAVILAVCIHGYYPISYHCGIGSSR